MLEEHLTLFHRASVHKAVEQVLVLQLLASREHEVDSKEHIISGTKL